MTIAPRVERAEPASQSKRAGRASGCDHEFQSTRGSRRLGFFRKSHARNRKLDRETPDLVRSNRAVFACRFFSFGG
jgi:hypothetical protein